MAESAAAACWARGCWWSRRGRTSRTCRRSRRGRSWTGGVRLHTEHLLPLSPGLVSLPAGYTGTAAVGPELTARVVISRVGLQEGGEGEEEEEEWGREGGLETRESFTERNRSSKTGREEKRKINERARTSMLWGGLGFAVKLFSPAEAKKHNGGKRETGEGVRTLEEGEAETERKSSRAPGDEARIHPERRQLERRQLLWRKLRPVSGECASS